MKDLNPNFRQYLSKYMLLIQAILLLLTDTRIKLRLSTTDEDMSKGFDLYDQNNGYRIAVRTRNSNYIKYNDLTIRSTLLPKINKKMTSHYCYFYEDFKTGNPIRIIIVDVHKMLKNENYQRIVKDSLFISNGDDTYFIPINFNLILDSIMFDFWF